MQRMEDFSAAKDVPTKKYRDTLSLVVVCNSSSVQYSVGQRPNTTEKHRHRHRGVTPATVAHTLLQRKDTYGT